jgi:hypothetical protein
MATHLLETNGTVREVHPRGAIWSLEELQGFVGGYIEVLRTRDGKYLVSNECAKIVDPPLDINVNATLVYRRGDSDYIAGPALIVDTKLELDGPDEEDDREGDSEEVN